MDAITIDKILLITLFFLPGFIHLKTYRLLIAEVKTDFSKDLYEAIGYSFFNNIVFAYPLYLINITGLIYTNTFLYFLILFGVILIAPVAWTFLFYFISKKKWYNKYFVGPTKSAWDSFFLKRKSYYVILTLKNGQKIGGKYGMQSHSSTYPYPKEIFLETVWKLNKNKDGLEKAIEKSAGIMITENEISTIEFYI